MSKYKILVKLSGSIAAYKTAYLISKLVQNDFEVQTVATNSSLEFIGKATLEGLTGKPVLTDQYESGKMMSHINLMKWADLILVCPASANTINKMSNGIADNLVTSLFLAYNFDKPYLIAPAMNTAMYNHPTTKLSLQKLTDWGITVLPTESGHLACGDVGEGKLIEPDYIYERIIEALKSKKPFDKNRSKILVTGGATRENIDGVRFISNLSTGKTASTIADELAANGFSVTFLHGINSALPKNDIEMIPFTDFKDLQKNLLKLISENKYDAIIHAAAVSDYTIDKIHYDQKELKPSLNKKIESSKNLILTLKPTEKILDKIKAHSKNSQVVLFAFKFSDKNDFEQSKQMVKKLIHSSKADYVVLNHLFDRNKKDQQTNFHLFSDDKVISKSQTAKELSERIIEILKQKTEIK